MVSSVGYIFPIFSLIFINTPLAYIFYFLTWIVVVYSHAFLIIFSWEIANLAKRLKFKDVIPWFVPYTLLLFLIIWYGIFLGGIRYDAGTGWIPTFTWNFAIFSWISFGIFMILPQFIISVIILRKFKGDFIRKRLIKYVFSVFLEFSIIMLVILYNTWTENAIYRILYFVFTVPSSFIAAYFVYKAVVHGLE
jgi:hypothetical protein